MHQIVCCIGYLVRNVVELGHLSHISTYLPIQDDKQKVANALLEKLGSSGSSS